MAVRVGLWPDFTHTQPLAQPPPASSLYTHPMKGNPLRLPRLLAAIGALPALSFAQAAKPAAPEPETVVLSPFVVDTSADQGYQATSTLAGSRLKTELKDVAASVTVLTNEFMDDLGATSVTNALAFVAGAETDATTDPTSVSSNGQGYLGGDFGDVNNRSDEVRVRGLGRASNTLNFIQTIGTSDRYNTERAEFLRGANSVLFGLAEPARLINTSSKVAKLRRNQASLDTKFDNFGSARAVLDVNRVLVKDRLALRAVGLESNQRYEVKNAFYHDRRLFLTGTYQPFTTTTLRVNYEAQKPPRHAAEFSHRAGQRLRVAQGLQPKRPRAHAHPDRRRVINFPAPRLFS